MSDWNDLVELLVNHFDVHVDVYKHGDKEDKFVDVEELAELQYDIEPGDIIGGVPVVVRDHGSDYSIVDPGVNPMSVVFEFQFESGTRWLEVFGYYVSHDGGYWEGYAEVKQRVKEVVVYE